MLLGCASQVRKVGVSNGGVLQSVIATQYQNTAMPDCTCHTQQATSPPPPRDARPRTSADIRKKGPKMLCISSMDA